MNRHSFLNILHEDIELAQQACAQDRALIDIQIDFVKACERDSPQLALWLYDEYPFNSDDVLDKSLLHASKKGCIDVIKWLLALKFLKMT